MAEQPTEPSDTAGDRAGYTVLARRYRPQQFDDCIGQDHVTGALKKAIEADRVAHAYLFTGARGVGKTSMARILAKALNCVRGPTPQPCDECDICRGIAAGDDVDVIEIDGASNNGVDHIRDLRQAVGYRPSRSRFKIYIIDEIHMLSPGAFNALLKTLEEPPSHVKFIFATTESQKILPTILSRCQRFDFAGLELDQIVDRLRQIVAAEGMEAEEEALETVARRAAGSMRDSQSLLDQVLAQCGGRLSADAVHRLLGTAADDRVFELAAAVLGGAAAACLQIIVNATATGMQLGMLVEQLLTYFRDLMVLSVAPEARLLSVPNRLRPGMLAQTRTVSIERIIEMMDILAECRSRMQRSTYARVLLESALVRLCRLDAFIGVAALMESAAPAPSTAAAAPARPTPAPLPPAASPPPEPAIAGTASIAAADPSPAPDCPLTAENVTAFWATALRQVNDIVATTQLEQAERVELRPPNTLVAWFPGRFAHTKTQCEEAGRLRRLEEACTALAGRPVTVRFDLTEAPNPGDNGRTNPHVLRSRAAKTPIVRRAEEVLGAKMLAVDLVASPAKKNPAPNPQDVEQAEP